MLFLELIGETDYTAQKPWLDVFRWVFSQLDKPFYGLLTILYKLFFNVATWDVFGKAFFQFFNRVQLIIGVYMVFQLALTILRGILDPESFGKNTTGAKGLIPRILISLVLLVVLLPVNIGGSGGSSEFKDRIANQGLLFGTLSSLQYRILNNNTVGRLILGTNDDTGFTASSSDASSGDDELDVSSRMFVATILKGFYRINLIPYDERVHEDDKTDDMLNDNRVCKNISADVLNKYTRLDAYPDDIINTLGETCPASNNFLGNVFKLQTGDYYYAFNHFLPFVSTIVGIILCFIMLSFSFDVAVRTIKLGILRLIAPIPIISHMDPNGSKDESLNTWTKTLVSTYLDLFVRLASVYFVIFIIQDMITGGFAIGQYEGVIGHLSLIIVWIGLFGFAKQVPKFIREILGLKGDGGSLFSGFATIGAAAGFGAAALGTIGSMRTNYRASKEENDELHPRHKVSNAFRNVGSAIAGGIGGGYTGVKAALGKDATPMSVLQAQSSRNATRASHSTLPGRVADSLHGMWTGRGYATEDQTKLDANKAAASSIVDYKKTAVEEAMKQGKGAWGTVSQEKDRFGKLGGIQFNYRQLEAAISTKDSSGNFDYTDEKGNVHHLNAAWFDSGVMGDIEDTQTANYLRSNLQPDGSFDNGKLNTAWRTARHDMGEAGISYAGSYLGSDKYSSIGAAIGTANSNVADMSTNMRNIMHRANNQQKK